MNHTNSMVLLTGAFGNLGQRVLAKLKAKGHRVRAMDLDTPLNREGAANATGNYDEVQWADIRTVDWAQALQGISSTIHLAAILPPVTDAAPALAEAVNVGASVRLIEALEQQITPIPLVFASSVTVFGYPATHTPKRAEDEPKPSDNYTRHKVAVEQRLSSSPIPWTVVRIGVSVDGHRTASKPMVQRMFATAADNPVEYVHPDDVATAAVNALDNPEALRRIFLLGGGKSCQVTQYDLLSASLDAMGIRLPKDMLGNEQFYTHWMDTAESQRVLQFQHHTFDDYRADLAKTLGRWRPLVKPFAPLVLWGLKRYLRSK